MNEKTFRIRLRTRSFSRNNTAIGIKTGHSTCENATYAYVATADGNTEEVKESHTKPSIICWTPKRSGILAKGRYDLFLALASVAPPTAASDPPATKLAVAEKHI
jgi:hypothetical protein